MGSGVGASAAGAASGGDSVGDMSTSQNAIRPVTIATAPQMAGIHDGGFEGLSDFMVREHIRLDETG